MKKTVLLLLLLLTITIKMFCQYYVSKSGLDTNPGTLLQPFKTIQQAANVMNAGGICYIMAGIYREKVTPVNNGTLSNPILFKNYQDDIVIISGSDSIGGWQVYKDGIYKAYVPDSVMQVFVDTVIANEAAYPNFRANRLSTNGWANVTITATGDATYTGMNFPQNYWLGGYCVNLVAKKWIAHNGIIDNSNGNLVHCTQRSIPWNNTTGTTYLGAGKGYITHHINALDTVNEWHWQNDTLYYYPQNPSVVSNSKIDARTRIYGFDCEGKEYIEIENLNFVCSSVNFENAKGCVLKKSNILYPTPYFYFLKSWDRQNTLRTDFSISSWTGKGITVSGSGNTIKQCYIAHSWGDGVTVGGLNNTIDSCLVEDCNWSATDDAPLSTVGRGHVITNNTMRHAARGILIHRITSRAIIIYNHFYDCGIMNDDLGITYSYNTNGDSTVISYNWVHDNHALGTVPGIYLDNFDTAYIVHHNVVWNCYGAMRTNLAAVNHQIYNNTLWGNSWSIMTSTNSVLVNQIVRNNLSNKTFAANIYTTQSNNLTTTTPAFTNLSQFDFTLTSTSPAKDYGVVIPGITDGYVGTAPDAGAYEYGATPWIPGTDVQPVYLSELLGETTGIHIISTIDNKLYVYPNPTQGKIYVNVKDAENISIEVYSIYGQKISTFINCKSIDLTDYPKGLYIVDVRNTKDSSVYSDVIILK